MSTEQERGLNVPLDDHEQRILAEEADRAGVTPQQYARDTLMSAIDERRVRDIARDVIARSGAAFLEHERRQTADRQRLRTEADAAAEELGERPLGSRTLRARPAA